MRPTFRSVSFPSLRQWGACCPPKRRRDYKETALLYGRVAGRLTWSVNARSAPLARSWLGRLAPLASLRSPLAPLVLGIAPPALATLRPTALQAFDLRCAVPLAPLVRSPLCSEKTAVFSRKKSVRGERTFFTKM